ncbi:hypothetical protein [Psychroserpens algicola]|uniref:Uncharacterized protein n=1 Tax=Psychroserpens algicola TaxID=1719034 RepID=A0ABT0HCJ0_9FLAO|nr:hypothetical protein [Psychroserpens algicola]MCK8481902.1 hypothetical protein [Psychroserpens algicola]
MQNKFLIFVIDNFLYNMWFSRIKDITPALLILTATFGYFLDEFIPNGINEIDLFFFKIGSFGFSDFSLFIFFMKMKVLILIFSIIWYYTCRHWWKKAILAIIAIELLKLINAFNYQQNLTDEIEYLRSFPVTVPILFLIIIFFKKIKNYYLEKDIRQKIDSEIDSVFFDLNKEKIEDLDLLKERFFKIRNETNSKNKHEYLQKLISLRDDFYKM